MSRKRREQVALAESTRRRRRNRLIAVVAALLVITLGVFLIPQGQRKEPAVKTYLALEKLPADDEAVRALIRSEFYNFDGFKVYQRELDIPIESLLLPDHLFTKAELEIIVSCINTIGFVNGDKDRVFLALKDWAERKPGRIIEELLPLDRKVAIRGKGYQYAFDAFWSPELKSIYMGRHQLPYFMLFLSTLYQEAYHAVQLDGRKITLEENAAIEHEAHKAQLEFNQKLRQFVVSIPENERRYRLELDVIDENLKASLHAYDQGLIERTGMRKPK